MNPNEIPFQLTDWSCIEPETINGETGYVTSKTKNFGELRIRMIEYSPGYKADHWCHKGHIIYCIDGEMDTELADGSVHTLKKGMTYQVSDDASSHRTSSKKGVKLFVVDGEFLTNKS